MSLIFNADEALEIAEQIERDGADFYRKAADNIQDMDKKDFLLELAEREIEHEKTFKSIRAHLSSEDLKATTYDPEGEEAAYLKSLADTRVFFEKEMNTETLEGILKSALAAEKDSIAFYVGMKKIVTSESGKKKLDEIIKEEMSHIHLLNQELLSLSG